MKRILVFIAMLLSAAAHASVPLQATLEQMATDADHILVDEVISTHAASVPKVLPVALDPFMHFTLGQIQDAHAGDTKARLILLKGSDFVGIMPGVFFRPLGDDVCEHSDAQKTF